MPNPKITISLYSKEYEKNSQEYQSGKRYNTTCFSELDNVIRIRDRITFEAKSAGKPIPEVEVLFLLIPSSDKINKARDDKEYLSYKDLGYLNTQEEFIQHARDLFQQDGIKVKDSYETLSNNEKKYLEGNKSIGSCIDIVKHRAIINHHGIQHLQTDSNIAISSFQTLYESTFGQNNDSFYASRDSKHHISSQNKIVYTGANGQLTEKLKERQDLYCEQQLIKGRVEESNDIYEKIFAPAMHDIGAVYHYRTPDKSNPNVTIDRYAARVADSRYELSKCCVPGKRQSWNSNKAEDPFTALNDVSINIDNEKYDIKNFLSLVTTFTDIPSWCIPPKREDILTEQEFLQNQEKFRLRTDGLNIAEASTSFNEFIGKQNQNTCMEIISSVYNACLKRAEELPTIKKEELMQNLAKTIPENAQGEAICGILFNCSVAELHTNPIRNSTFSNLSISNESDLSKPNKKHDQYAKILKSKSFEFSNYDINIETNKTTYDTSDLILLTFEKLSKSVDKSIKNQILTQYLNHEYDSAIELLKKNLPKEKQEKFMVDFENSKNNNKAENNYSRRYFETIMAASLINISEEESSSITKLAEFMRKTDPKLYQEKISDKEIYHSENNHMLIKKRDQIFDLVRIYEEEVSTITKLKEDIISQDGSIYKHKDRSKEKKDTQTLSSNPGIITSIAPLFANKTLENEANKPVDTHHIDPSITEGFSATHQTVPFVNSLSGTTYGLVAILKIYMEKNKNDPELSKDVNNIIKQSIAFRIKKGFHSYQEMNSVLNSPEVVKIFKELGVKINNIFKNQDLEKSVKNASIYALEINKKRILNNEIKSELSKKAKNSISR